MQAIMVGTPESADLHAVVHDGRTALMVGGVMLASYDNDDTGLRNMAVVMLTQMGFASVLVARVVGLTPEYVSMLRGHARRHGSAGLMQRRGRPAKLSVERVRQARAWKVDGLTDAEIARRLKVSHKTAARAAASVEPTMAAQPMLDALDDAGSACAPVTAETDGRMSAASVEPAAPISSDVDSDGSSATDGAAARIRAGRFNSRYAGAMLLHAFTGRVGGRYRRAARAAHPAPATGGDRRPVRPVGVAALVRQGDARCRAVRVGAVLHRRAFHALRRGVAGRQGMEHQTPSRRARTGRHHARRREGAGDLLRQRRAVGPVHLAAPGAGPAPRDPGTRR